MIYNIYNINAIIYIMNLNFYVLCGILLLIKERKRVIKYGTERQNNKRVFD